MTNFTSNTYQMKREILSFSNKISKNLPKSQRKFMADMNYGILASKDCFLTDIVDQLHEPSRKINIVDRLSRHLAKGTPKDALRTYLTKVKKWCPDQPVIHIDDSDVVKPDGYKFESLGWVRDGSESTATKNVYKKGYHVTEPTVLTSNSHPVSIFSEIHSSKEKDFTFINDVTFCAMDRAAALFKKATFVMDRGYDDNKMFLKLVQRCANNYTNHLPAFPIAQVKNPQRSPLRLRFLTCTLRKAFCVIDPVICRTMY